MATESDKEQTPVDGHSNMAITPNMFRKLRETFKTGTQNTSQAPAEPVKPVEPVEPVEPSKSPQPPAPKNAPFVAGVPSGSGTAEQVWPAIMESSDQDKKTDPQSDSAGESWYPLQPKDTVKAQVKGGEATTKKKSGKAGTKQENLVKVPAGSVFEDEETVAVDDLIAANPTAAAAKKSGKKAKQKAAKAAKNSVQKPPVKSEKPNDSPKITSAPAPTPAISKRNDKAPLAALAAPTVDTADKKSPGKNPSESDSPADKANAGSKASPGTKSVTKAGPGPNSASQSKIPVVTPNVGAANTKAGPSPVQPVAQIPTVQTPPPGFTPANADPTGLQSPPLVGTVTAGFPVVTPANSGLRYGPNSIIEIIRRNAVRVFAAVDRFGEKVRGTSPESQTVDTAEENKKVDPTRYAIGFAAIVAIIALALSTWTLLRPAPTLGGKPTAPVTDPSSSAPAKPGDDSPTSSEPPAILAATSVDPHGDGEHPELEPRMIDGNPATSWLTRFYKNSTFGSKPGTGVGISLRAKSVVKELIITTSVTGGKWEIRATDSNNPVAGKPLATGEFTAPQTVIKLPAGTVTSSLVLWVTELPRDAAGKNRVQIAELAVR